MSLSPHPPVTVALARFEDLVAVGLRALIDGDETLSLIAADIESADLTERLCRCAPDVAILNFATLQSPAQLRELAAAHPAVRLVILADNPTPTESRQLIGFGATAYLAKASEARDVLHAIHLASRGLQVLPGDGGGEPAPEPTGPAPLTERETDVLALLHEGCSNAEIAAALHIGVETVRTHARHIFRKLGVANRRELRAPA